MVRTYRISALIQPGEHSNAKQMLDEQPYYGLFPQINWRKLICATDIEFNAPVWELTTAGREWRLESCAGLTTQLKSSIPLYTECYLLWKQPHLEILNPLRILARALTFLQLGSDILLDMATYFCDEKIGFRKVGTLFTLLRILINIPCNSLKAVLTFGKNAIDVSADRVFDNADTLVEISKDTAELITPVLIKSTYAQAIQKLDSFCKRSGSPASRQQSEIYYMYRVSSTNTCSASDATKYLLAQAESATRSPESFRPPIYYPTTFSLPAENGNSHYRSPFDFSGYDYEEDQTEGNPFYDPTGMQIWEDALQEQTAAKATILKI